MTEAEGQARERLLYALHEAGIDAGSPLGLLLTQMLESAEALTVEARATRQSLMEVLSASEAELSDLKASLVEGCTVVSDLRSAGETRLRNQELQMQREHQDVVAKMVAATTIGLRDAVFGQLRQQLPIAEREFFHEARWRSWARMAGAAAIVLTIGALAGMALTWRDARVGAWCGDRLHIYRSSGGTAYCHIPDLDGVGPGSGTQ
ncbi:hypothetical protein HLH33_09810 [Gluconacetobacter diazotrophicus]|uniref:Uncharacterized protein n=1 Tax=Gluconacetobacter diazotrophicus TaxID=33996 RepID=A0A7W4FFI7_GLUDI|nr:hypothetical protein [Gluconacetobacter diazotrophicus]MBB2156599.1 hypothetical protein [Gluconacetobacter diazotrophicus]